jgi:acyl-CoA reductase-like NAD-dependent aldehyde dehydrogenase
MSDALLQVVPTAMRGGLQSCGQNCAGAERFIVAAPLFDEFTARVVDTARRLRQVQQLVLYTVRSNNMSRLIAAYCLRLYDIVGT